MTYTLESTPEQHTIKDEAGAPAITINRLTTVAADTVAQATLEYLNHPGGAAAQVINAAKAAEEARAKG